MSFQKKKKKNNAPTLTINLTKTKSYKIQNSTTPKQIPPQTHKTLTPPSTSKPKLGHKLNLSREKRLSPFKSQDNFYKTL